MVGIYKITNKVNGKIYIGQSRCITQRWKAHKNKPFNKYDKQYDSYFYASIRKYGVDNFQFDIIETCLIEELNEREKYWINFYNSYNNGYNLTDGGGQQPHNQKIEWYEADEIIDTLINTNLSQTDISNEYNISQPMISEINLGKSWKKNYLKYPLRKGNQFGKNLEKQKEFICKQCGVDISKGAQLCLDCFHINNRKVDRPSREALKILIRTVPFTTIGKQFNVSDNAIRKWCKSKNLPFKSSEIKKYTDLEWEKI